MEILLAPGPVPVLDEISKAQCREMITHRSGDFTKLYTDLVERLKKYFHSYESYVITGSGALGLETLALNLCENSDKAICFPNGEFGGHLATTFGVYSTTIVHELDGGKGWDLERAKKHMDDSNAQVLSMVYNETGYGVKNNIKEICKYAKSKGMLTIIDGISAWPGTEFDMKSYNVDGFVTGSQKGIGAPPGMALLGLSQEAVDFFSKRDNIPAYYMNLKRHKNRYEKDQQTPNTPAISLFWALQKAFDVLDKNGGLSGAVKRHEHAAAYTRKRLGEMGFKMIAEKGFESNTVTGFVCKNPEQVKSIKSKLASDYNIKIVGARGVYLDNGLRIAHMGNFKIEWIEECLDRIETIIK